MVNADRPPASNRQTCPRARPLLPPPRHIFLRSSLPVRGPRPQSLRPRPSRASRFFFLMIRRPPRSTRLAIPVSYPALLTPPLLSHSVSILVSPSPKVRPFNTSKGPGPNRTPPSQMVGGPPPINTGAPVPGYPPPMQMQGGPPVPGGPPGYTGGAGYPPPAPPQGQPLPTAPYTRPAAEVEGNSRSKAQLIVGIDFVSFLPKMRSSFSLSSLLTAL